MITENELLSIADAYAAATGVSDTTISSRVFDDGKKLSALREGKDISVRRANSALQWFSDNWPNDAPWPRGVERPFRGEIPSPKAPSPLPLDKEQAVGGAR